MRWPQMVCDKYSGGYSQKLLSPITAHLLPSLFLKIMTIIREVLCCSPLSSTCSRFIAIFLAIRILLLAFQNFLVSSFQEISMPLSFPLASASIGKNGILLSPVG